MTLDPGLVWSALPVPALLVDARDCIAEANPAAELFLNTAARALRGAPVWDRLRLSNPQDGALARVRRDRSALIVNTKATTSSQPQPQPCTIRIAPLGRDDEILILIEPHPHDDRLGRAANKTSAKSAIGMAEMLSHEIKNPLAGITGAAQLLAMNLDPQDQELTDLIVAESRRIVQLLTQVEEFGNLRPPERRAVNLHDVLDRARKSASVGIAAAMTIVEDYDPSLPPTHVDGDQLLQVILNLLKNAAEAAGPSGGTIRLRTFYDHGLSRRLVDGTALHLPLQIEVIDDGPGLPVDLGDHIFEPFVSGRENGTGLGLALVSKIITEHDGWIAVESAPGRTAFRISLPVAPSERTP